MTVQIFLGVVYFEPIKASEVFFLWKNIEGFVFFENFKIIS